MEQDKIEILLSTKSNIYFNPESSWTEYDCNNLLDIIFSFHKCEVTSEELEAIKYINHPFIFADDVDLPSFITSLCEKAILAKSELEKAQAKFFASKEKLKLENKQTVKKTRKQKILESLSPEEELKLLETLKEKYQK